MHPDEVALIMAFIVPAKQDRYCALLGNPKRRHKITARLSHNLDLDERYTSTLPASTDVVALLQSKGAPATCHLTSASAALDGKDLPLAVAVSAVEATMEGTLVSCRRGKLAYHYGEAGQPRLLLERETKVLEPS